MNLIGSAGQHPTDDADVAFLGNVVDVDWIVGGHSGGYALLQHDDSGRLVDVQRHLSVVLVDARTFDADDAS